MFLFMGFGAAHIANLPDASSNTSNGEPFVNTANLTFIATAFGLALLINVWIFYRVSGAVFNPAITLGLVLAGVITPMRGFAFSVAQIVGGITAAALIHVLMTGPLNVNTRLNNNVSITQGQSHAGNLISRSVHRDVFDGAIGHVRVYACRGKTQGYLSRACWDWIDVVC